MAPDKPWGIKATMESALPLATWIVVFVPMPLLMALALLGFLSARRDKRE